MTATVRLRRYSIELPTLDDALLFAGRLDGDLLFAGRKGNSLVFKLVKA